MDDKQKDHIKQMVRGIRMATGLSQKDFADRVGISQNSMNRLENGHRLPDMEFLVTIRTLFHIDLNQLVDRNKDLDTTDAVPVYDDEQLSLPPRDRRTYEFLTFAGDSKVDFYYKVKDDGMAPTVGIGDWVGVSDEEAKLGDIVLVRDLTGVVQVRRLGRCHGEGDTLFVTDKIECTVNSEQTAILGRVCNIIRRKKI